MLPPLQNLRSATAYLLFPSLILVKRLNNHLRLQVGIASASGGSAALFMLSAVRDFRVLCQSASGLHTPG